MKVTEIMSKKITVAEPRTTLPKLWELIFKKHVHAVPVIDAKKKVLGIVAEEDLLKPLYPDHRDFVENFVNAGEFEEMEERIHDLSDLTAEKLMNRRIIFVRPESPILRALSRMIVHDVHQLPVLSEEGFLVGIITKGDVFDNLFTKHLRKRFNKGK